MLAGLFVLVYYNSLPNCHRRFSGLDTQSLVDPALLIIADRH